MAYGYIYRITNVINGKPYVGQSTDYESRWKSYKLLQCKGQPKIYKALKKYGVHNFTFELITEAWSQEMLDTLETICIRLYNSMKMGYNCDEGGDGHGKMCEETILKLKSIQRTPEFKQKVSQNNARYWKGKERSKETKLKISMNNGRPTLGKHHSPETRSKISESRKGYTHSDETRKKLSVNNAHARLGKHHTEEARQKISESQRGEKSIHYGIPLSVEHRRKISQANKGKPRSEEWKRKISESCKARRSLQDSEKISKTSANEA